jgi:mycofactocin precursor
VDEAFSDEGLMDEELHRAEMTDQPDDAEPLIEEISIDGMCGVY